MYRSVLCSLLQVYMGDEAASSKRKKSTSHATALVGDPRYNVEET